MSIHRRNARRDANEAPIVKALKQVGASVARLSDAGMPDLIVWYRGSIFLLEVKTATGRARIAQVERLAEGWPVVTVRTVDAALRAIGVIR